MRIYTTAALLSAIATSSQAEMARYELDTTHTATFFTIEHIGFSKTLGIFTEVTGSFMYDSETQELGDVQVSINADSVDTFDDARDGHVKNKDFLDVKNHPEITFVADSGSPESANSGTVTGDLTILGQTHPVTLNVNLNKAEEYPFGHKRFVLGLSIDTTINRSDFGMSYGVANGLVGDAVDIKIETEAMKME